MELPQGQVDEQVWREHAERAKSYDGTLAAYCRLYNLDYDKFMYYRGRQAVMRSAGSGGFAKIEAKMPVAQAAPALKPKNYPQLPDPKWLAEFIHNLGSR